MVIWGVLFYFLRPPKDEWIIFLIFFALPLPAFFPIYNRYRQGITRDWFNRTPRHHLTWATLSAVYGAVFIGYALHRSGWDRAFYLTLAAGWLAGSADHFRRWAKTKASI